MSHWRLANFIYFWGSVLLCSPGWPWPFSPPASDSQVLGLKVCTTTPGLLFCFEMVSLCCPGWSWTPGLKWSSGLTLLSSWNCSCAWLDFRISRDCYVLLFSTIIPLNSSIYVVSYTYLTIVVECVKANFFSSQVFRLKRTILKKLQPRTYIWSPHPHLAFISHDEIMDLDPESNAEMAELCWVECTLHLKGM
jgi:hypothetical protein